MDPIGREPLFPELPPFYKEKEQTGKKKEAKDEKEEKLPDDERPEEQEKDWGNFVRQENEEVSKEARADIHSEMQESGTDLRMKKERQDTFEEKTLLSNEKNNLEAEFLKRQIEKKIPPKVDENR